MARAHERTRHILVRLCAVLLLMASGLPAARAGQLDLLSKVFAPRRASDTASGESDTRSLSADGRFLVFLSTAANLVPGQIDENNFNDVFLHDRVTGTTLLVSRSISSPATAGDARSNDAVISADGRYVAFESWANNLVAGQVDSQAPDVFLFDRVTGTTTLVSRSAASVRTTGNGASSSPVLSADGRYVAFTSQATNLVAGQTVNNGNPNVFLWDRRSGRTTLVSHAAGTAARATGSQLGPASISADGRWIAFSSFASDLVAGQTGESRANVFLFDRFSGKNILVSRVNGSTTTGSGGSTPVLSANGESVAFESPGTNLVAGQTASPGGEGDSNIFVFHRPSGQMKLVSHASSSPTQTAGLVSFASHISADGAWVAFLSRARNLVAGQVDDSFTFDVFLWERATGNLRVVSRKPGSPATTAGGETFLRGLSADGGQILLESETNLVNPLVHVSEVNVFLADRSGHVVLVSSPDASGTSSGNDLSFNPVLSADGNWVAFASDATDLEPGLRDLNKATDVFLFGRTTANLEIVSRRDPGLPALAVGGGAGDLSADGRYGVFVTGSPDIAIRVSDLNGDNDVYLYDRMLKTLTLVSHAAAGALRTANKGSGSPRISADGRFVIYLSEGTDLVPGQIDQTDDDADLFLYDRTTGQTTLVSRTAESPVTGAGAAFGHAISADGSTIVFTSLQDNVFLYNRASGAIALVSHAHGSATQPADDFSRFNALSADGRYIVIGSSASDLVPDLPAGVDDLFTLALYLYDKTTGALTLITRPSSPGGRLQGGGEARISADGRWVAFSSVYDNLVPGQVETGDPGTFTPDVFLWDRVTQTTRLVSHDPASPVTARGGGSGLAMSADGRYIAFDGGGGLAAGYRGSRNIRHILLYDRTTAANRLVTSATGSDESNISTHPEMSADGRYIAFVSDAPRLSPEPIRTRTSNLFLYDRTTGKTTLASRSTLPPFNSGNGPSGDTSTSRDDFGRVALSTNGILMFESVAANLVAGDYNLRNDVFLYVP